jgi:hypothetical protein
MSERTEMLRHFLASIAYHATKALKNAPENFPNLYVGEGVRTPLLILKHISSVLTYAHSFYEDYDDTYLDLRSWDFEVKRFYRTLEQLDKSIQVKPPKAVSEERLLQGPFSDVMTHIGQLSMLRRLAGSPIPSENFLYADIRKGVLGPDQPEPVAPDE